MRKSILILLLFGLGALPRAGFAFTMISFNSQSDGRGCLDVRGAVPFVPFSVYIVAYLSADAAAAGITGAEFRATGFDPAWFVTVTANPAANISLGDPVDPLIGGCNIAFAGCQVGPSVLLYSIQILSLSPIVNRFLNIDRRTVPTNPNYACPGVTLCDGPVFTQLCVRPGRGGINLNCYCGCVAVQATTWSMVKSSYGNAN